MNWSHIFSNPLYWFNFIIIYHNIIWNKQLVIQKNSLANWFALIDLFRLKELNCLLWTQRPISLYSHIEHDSQNANTQIMKKSVSWSGWFVVWFWDNIELCGRNISDRVIIVAADGLGCASYQVNIMMKSIYLLQHH